MNPARTRVERTLATVLLAGFLACTTACGNDGPLPARPDDRGRPDEADVAVEDAWDLPQDPARSSDPGVDADALSRPGPAHDTPEPDARPGDLPDAAPPGADTSADALPQECPPAGTVFITELLPDPAAVPDVTGEYVEVYNPGETGVDLRGFDLRSGRESHRIHGDSPVRVPAHGFLLMAVSANPDDNGGLAPGYVYDSVRLSNGADDVGLYCSDAIIDRVSWSASSFGLKAGFSLSLDRTGFDATKNDDAGYWCRGVAPYGAGDHGTPGEDNPSCGTGSCGDGRLQHWEECDDGNRMNGDGCSASCQGESFEAGSIIVTEVLVQPVGTGKTVGEWVELHNPTPRPIDIDGWTLGDDAGTPVRIQPSSGSLVVPSLGYVVLGRSADSDVNGGVSVDWSYGDAFALGSPAGQVIVTWNGSVIDKVVYALGTTFPEAPGRSLQLDPAFLDGELNDWSEAWCAAPDSAVLPDGDHGSPGTGNPPCQWNPTRTREPAPPSRPDVEYVRRLAPSDGRDWRR